MTPRNGQMHMHQGPDFFSLLCSMHHLFQSYFAQQNKSISVICISVASSFNCINVPISTTRLPLPPRGGHRAQQRCWHLVHLTHLTLGSLLPCLNSCLVVRILQVTGRETPSTHLIYARPVCRQTSTEADHRSQLPLHRLCHGDIRKDDRRSGP
uniref:Uncharacterized protein n=1 Tax=Aegilops tauschii subsp. strangulata TaxID=200361 RepID=A0A453KRT5_AEGTS